MAQKGLEVRTDPAVGHSELAPAESLVSVVRSWNGNITLHLVAWPPDGWQFARTT